MDDIKDVGKKDTLDTFLDSTSIRTDPFGHNIIAERAYRRAERIAAAIHLITNHIPEAEPIRIYARGTGLDLLSGTLALRDSLRNSAAREYVGVLALVRKAISYMRVLSVSGRISQNNAEAIIAALDDLGIALTTSQRSHLAESISFKREDFSPEDGSGGAARLMDISRRPIKNTARSARPKSVMAPPQQGRSDEIVSVLGSQGQLGIKDIVANLPSYSEKMIQRELKRLVELGRVQKTGSKRWSTYALAKQ